MSGLSYLVLACAALATISVVTGCAMANGEVSNEAMVATTGTVVFNDLEGGFWGIVAADGERYDPTNLDKSFQIDGLKIRFKARLRGDVVNFHMWGTIAELVFIEKLE